MSVMPATSLTHTHAHRAMDDGGGGDMGSRGAPRAARGSVNDGFGGECQCEDGVVDGSSEYGFARGWWT